MKISDTQKKRGRPPKNAEEEQPMQETDTNAQTLQELNTELEDLRTQLNNIQEMEMLRKDSTYRYHLLLMMRQMVEGLNGMTQAINRQTRLQMQISEVTESGEDGSVD